MNSFTIIEKQNEVEMQEEQNEVVDEFLYNIRGIE